MNARRRTGWTFAITSAALFMASLDNLVVTTALPSIREHLHASLEGLQWTVNAYTLTFAVLLLTGATLGERYGRRRMFTIGLALFTAGSAAAALAPGIDALVTARAVQGAGAAIVIPLTLTLLSAAVSPQRRGLALGAWGAVGGLAIAIGPLVGGAVVEGASWQWIFWLNVPIGVVLLPIARLRLTESRGPSTSLDLPGLVLASVGLLGIVLGVVRGNDHGWTSVTVLPPLVIGALLVAAFIGWELRARQPMLPLYLRCWPRRPKWSRRPGHAGRIAGRRRPAAAVRCPDRPPARRGRPGSAAGAGCRSTPQPMSITLAPGSTPTQASSPAASGARNSAWASRWSTSGGPSPSQYRCCAADVVMSAVPSGSGRRAGSSPRSATAPAAPG